MKSLYIILIFSLLNFANLSAQQTTLNQSTTAADSLAQSLQINGYQRILSNLSGIPQGVTIGGYGEILYNQPNNLNGELDVQRLVMLFGYKFDDRVQFVTEIEYEHVKEVYVEQAFVCFQFPIRSKHLQVTLGYYSKIVTQKDHDLVKLRELVV